MENSNITKQAKSDIFKELYTVINFYISKGATPKALKKYYKNTKRLDDIIDDIKSKGSNLITDEEEYKKLVKNTLNDMLDDFMAKQKDDEYKNKQQQMKHIKEFYNFENTNESIMDTVYLFAIGFFLYKFILSIIKNSLNKKKSKLTDETKHLQVQNIIGFLKNKEKVPIIDLNDRYFMRLEDDFGNSIDIRIMKEDKIFKVDTEKGDVDIQLSDNEYNEFLKLIKKED